MIIRSKFKLDKDFLDRAVNLKFIARQGAGMENIDTDYAASRGILCLNSPEGNRDALGEHATGMLLSLFNHLCRADQQVRQGIWDREGNRGLEIKGKTIAIIGYGNMGSAFAQRLKGFECSIIAYDKYKSGFGNDLVEEVGMEEVFSRADVLSLHVPLTNETSYLIDKNFINKFHKNIYLVNTARGKNVKTDDLVYALKTGKIKAAALDVLEYEDTSFEELHADRPPALDYLVKADNVLLSPHIAGFSAESKIKLARFLGEKIIKAFKP
jgi:D-3-phosphoglycerate dehydrogenase